MEVVVLGCGPSSGIPALRCVVKGDCSVCMEAYRNPNSKNHRLNPSLLVRNLQNKTNILVDCGKTFREAVLRTFPVLGVQHIDAILLTHGHADACLGMDDIREVQKFDSSTNSTTGENIKKASLPMGLHCSAATKNEIGDKFSYLMEKEEERIAREANTSIPPGDGTNPPVFRWVAKLQWQVFDWFDPFNICGLQVTPFPVIHGAGYHSSAFEFGAEFGVRFVYISDVSELPFQAKEYLYDHSRPQIDVLMIDALYIDRYHSTHMNLVDVVREVSHIRPKLALLTGMSHEFDYDKTSQQLDSIRKQQGIDIRMGFDGMQISFQNSEIILSDLIHR